MRDQTRTSGTARTGGGVLGAARTADGVVGGTRGADSKIGALRRRLEVSRRALAKLCGVNEMTVERWETGADPRGGYRPGRYRPREVQRVVLDALELVAEDSVSRAAGIVAQAQGDLPGALRALFAEAPQ